MDGDGKEKLRIKMFGGFTAEYGTEVLTFGKQANSRYGQLFQLLMMRPGRDFGKQYVMECLYGQGMVEDRNASLNNTIFRLRRYLEESPLPTAEYLTVAEGRIRFEETVPIESDVWEFQRLAEYFEKETDVRKRMELCEQACGLYQGEFLPQLSNEPWVIHRSRYYQDYYRRMLQYLLSSLREERNYRRMGELAGEAAQIHPFEEWEIWQMESLISQGRQREALEIYEKTAESLRVLEEAPSEEWMTRFREVGNKLAMPSETVEEVLQHLTENGSLQGAYACNILVFLDYFRILLRIQRRGDVRFCALLCTVMKRGGRQERKHRGCERQGEKLEKIFQTYLRAGDAYTKYNENQYLLLCVGAAKEDVSQIGGRIDAEFQRRCNGQYRIQCQELAGEA